jgi:tetratricopeptide (TPR) repeat protein
VAWALVNKGIALGELKRHEEAMAVFDEVVRRFGEATEPDLRERVARALVSKGVVLGQLKRHEEEITVYDEVVRRFGEATEPGLREQVRRARANKQSASLKHEDTP